MPYKLYIGNKRYSSWSCRPWVLLKALDIPFEEQLQIFQQGYRQPGFRSFSPVARVPCLHDTDNDVVQWDSLGIVEYIAEAYPQVWPTDAKARAWARCAVAEMHSSFQAIRDQCGMNVGLRIELGEPSQELRKDMERLTALFEEGLNKFQGPWLAGKNFTAADAFFAPIASRRKTFGLKFEGPAEDYLERLFNHPAMQEWVDAGRREKDREPGHEDESIGGRTIIEDLAL